ncbi:hypothetical protein O0I10_006516 [Lichtheimia ornata]|uniref:Uncharacterized protein n=1 Tax=Lichtheimia ornata TaxID=688661 RepID=A0AAD7V4X5_9FUNG|nr:uncharacterized protein O0I10_006516 [Lichtheimia ornata]KAJ8657701.1 hypothetical protein O0I10_006516 [Lichtheimia ornata]
MTVENQEYHPEWGILREQDFVQLALKHQRDLETHFTSGTLISDFHFWQANLGGYCMADMVQNVVVSPDGVFSLERRMVQGAPRVRRKKSKPSHRQQS